MHHKRHKVKQSRSGCMMCKPQKNSHNKTAERMKSSRKAFKIENEAYG